MPYATTKAAAGQIAAAPIGGRDPLRRTSTTASTAPASASAARTATETLPLRPRLRSADVIPTPARNPAGTVSAPSSARVSRPRSQPSAAETATTSAGTRIQASTSVEGDLRFTGRECSLPPIMGAERKLPPVTGPGRIDTEFAAPQLASDRLTPTSPEPLISFVVPAYNEASSLQDVLQRVYTLPLRAEVIAVDDGSTDRTAEILERFAESHELTEDDFRIEPEITAQVLDRKLRLYQLPIAYYGRAYDEGKKIGWRDGPPAVWTLLRLRFGSSRRRRSG